MAKLKKRPLISICVPIFNEAENINSLYTKLESLSDSLKSDADFEFMFTDNHSTDDSWQMINELAKKDSRVRALRFTKNFGFQKSLWTNYINAKGDVIFQLDADLQDPPELLAEFLDKWKSGYKIVYGIRERRQESFLMVIFRRIGYWLINLFSGDEIPENVGDFQLLDRSVIETIGRGRFAKPYLRGMIASTGMKSIGIRYSRDARRRGKSKFNLIKIIKLGLNGILNHSTIPLRVSSFIGSLILILSALGAIYYVTLKLIDPNLPQGLASIHILVLFGIGLNSFLLGIIGEYILNIYLLLRKEPLVIVEDTINLVIDELNQ